MKYFITDKRFKEKIKSMKLDQLTTYRKYFQLLGFAIDAGLVGTAVGITSVAGETIGAVVAVLAAGLTLINTEHFSLNSSKIWAEICKRKQEKGYAITDDEFDPSEAFEKQFKKAKIQAGNELTKQNDLKQVAGPENTKPPKTLLPNKR